MFDFVPSRNARMLLGAGLVALTIAVPGSAAGEEADRPNDTIVVTAAGFEQKITDAPASISVITAEELATRPYMTLLDAVRDLEGVDIGETRDKTGQGTISVRGMGSDYTLILINGRRQNNHGDIYPNNFGGNQFNHIPPLDAIERIEVIRGPASTLYGADAMGGVINVITKRDLDRWSGAVTAARTFETHKAYGDDTTLDAYVTGPLVPGLLTVAARGSWYHREASNPVYESVTDPAGDTHNRSLGFGGGGKTVDNKNWTGGVTLTFTPTDNQTLSLDYDVSRQKYDNEITFDDDGNPVYPVGTVDNIESVWRATPNRCIPAGTCTRADPRVGYAPEQEFTRDTWSIAHQGRWGFGNSRISLSHVATNNDGRTMPFTVAERNLLLEMINATGEYAGLSEDERRDIAEATFLPRPKRTLESAQYTLDAQLDVPFELAGSHVAVLGGQVIRGELTDGVFGMESGNPGQTQDHNMFSIFAEDTWTIFEPFALTGGLRYDDHEVFGSHVSPRLYGVLTLSDQLTVKGGVSTGFKTPKTTQLYDGITGFGGQGTSPMFGNPDLQPETSVSTELAVYWEHPDGHNFNATVFNNEFEDKIANQPCGPGTDLPCANAGEYADLGYGSSSRATNIDRVVIRGIELAGRVELLESLTLGGNYTLTDSEQKSGADIGRPLGNTARHMANARLDWRATDRLSLAVNGEIRSRRYRSFDTATNRELYYKSYTVLHLSGSYDVTDWLRVNARVNNLLDRDFTSYQTLFADLDSDGLYQSDGEVSFVDDFNNKDKRRSFWISVNARF